MLVSLAADVDVVHVRSLLLVRSNRNRRSDGWLGHLLHLHTPLVLRLLQVAQSELRLPVRHSHVYSVLAQHTVDFGNHLGAIGCGVFSALDSLSVTKMESMVALSMTASKEASGKSMARASMSRYLKVSGFSLYFSFMALTQTLEMSMFVICVYPSSNISSLSRELPAPTFRILWPLSTWVVMISLRPLKRWYQSKGSGSLRGE
jgi:hypothetical protein